MNTEALAGWYFRLNGFFTIRNFILHPARRGGQRTDVDIAGVRFPYRAEFPDGASADEPEFNRGDNKPYIVIAEVKTTRCGLNGPWTDPTKENMQAVLGALGAIPEEEIQEAAEALYREGAFDSADMYCALFSVGDVVNADLSQAYPKVPQRTWVEILEFVYERFLTYRRQKADHQSWDEAGQELWRLAEIRTKETFISEVRAAIGVR